MAIGLTADTYAPAVDYDDSLRARAGLPQVRDFDTPFYPRSLERGTRYERAVKLAVAEMDEELETWRNRPIWEVKVLFLDATFHKALVDGLVVPVATFVVAGILADGHRAITSTCAPSRNYEHGANLQTKPLRYLDLRRQRLVYCSLVVGFFDSGYGGLCILEAFRRLCPDEETVYIADSKNCPYGNKSAEEIRRLSINNARILIEKHHCKMVVVACNTATAAAIDVLRKMWPKVPFIGLEPAVKPAALRSKTGVVGVLATAGTFNGRLYNETKAKFAKGVTVLATVADEWVTEVEKFLRARVLKSSRAQELGLSARERARLEKIVRRRVEPLLAAGADKLVLGCTHFPHLKPIIEKVAAGRAEVIDPSDAVARQAKRVLETTIYVEKTTIHDKTLDK